MVNARLASLLMVPIVESEGVMLVDVVAEGRYLDGCFRGDTSSGWDECVNRWPLSCGEAWIGKHVLLTEQWRDSREYLIGKALFEFIVIARTVHQTNH